MKNYVIYFLLISFCLQSYAQDEIDIDDENVKEIEKKESAFAISVGSPGSGLEYARNFSSKLSAKVAWNFFSIEDFKQENINLSGSTVDVSADLKTSIIDLGIEYLPFKNSSFKLTGGLGILSNVRAGGVLTYTEEVVVGTVVISKKDVGEIVADVTWSGIAPYIGVGFGRAVPKEKIEFGIELGTYFASSPNVNLTASQLLAPTASQQEYLQESLEGYKFIPRIQFKTAYKF